MASAKILENKKAIVEEIKSNIQNSESVVIFTYQGLTVSELSLLRKELKKTESEVKVYKNTLFKRAVDDLGINLDGFLEGPNAILFGKDLLEPIKVISEFVKEHENANITVGIIDGAKAELDVIKEYASIPSRDGLLTMLAGGMIQYVKETDTQWVWYSHRLTRKPIRRVVYKTPTGEFSQNVEWVNWNADGETIKAYGRTWQGQ